MKYFQNIYYNYELFISNFFGTLVLNYIDTFITAKNFISNKCNNIVNCYNNVNINFKEF